MISISSNHQQSLAIPASSRIIQTVGEKTQQNVVPAQSDPSLITPEDVNDRAQNVDNRIEQNQQAQEQQRTTARTAAVGISAAQQQQQVAEIFIEQSSDTEIDNNSAPSLTEVADIAQQARRADNINTLSDVSESKNQLDKNIADLTRPEQGASFSFSV